MEARSERSRAMRDLMVAHRELSAIEWLELKSTVMVAAGLLSVAAVLLSVGWLAVNAALVFALRADLPRALAVLAAGNLFFGALAAWRAGRLLTRPFFVETRRELATNGRAVLRSFL